MATIDDDEEPLDPALLRVQAKLRRLMMIGGLTLGLGIFAVLIAIVYRISQSGPDEPASPATAAIAEITADTIGLSPDAALVSVALDGGRMALAFRDGADTVTVLIDTTTMAVLGRFSVRGR
jgi:hypothetical protein